LDRPIPHRVALAFMAHPDDAEMMCGETLIRLGDAGWEAHIVTTAGGACGSMTEPTWKISAIRREEARKAAAQAGHAGGSCQPAPVAARPPRNG